MPRPHREKEGKNYPCFLCSKKAGKPVFHPREFFSKDMLRKWGVSSSCKEQTRLRVKQYQRKYTPKIPCEPAEKSPLGGCNRNTMAGFLEYYAERPEMWKELAGGQPFCLSTAKRVFYQQQKRRVSLSDLPDERNYGSKATTYRPAA